MCKMMHKWFFKDEKKERDRIDLKNNNTRIIIDFIIFSGRW